MTDAEVSRPWNARRVLGMGVLALAGAAAGAAFASVTSDRLSGWEDHLAALIGLSCVLSGVAAGATVLLRPLTVPSGCAWLQVAGLLLAGLLMLLPVFAPEAWPRPPLYAGVLILLAAQSVASLVLWRKSDELFRTVIVETGAVCFWVMQALFFAYAAAERLGLTPTLSAWGLMGLLMTGYLFASLAVTIRRGLST